jgi:signal transduction histidine kinase
MRLLLNALIIPCILFCHVAESADYKTKGISKTDSILKVIKHSQNTKERIVSYEYLSSLYADQENFDSAHMVIDSAISISRKTGDDYFVAKTTGSKGKLYRQQGKFENSLETLLIAYDLAEKIREKELVMIISNNLGVTYRRLAEDNKALKYHLEALGLAEELDNKKNEAIATNSIGIIYTYQENYDEALAYFYKALALEEERKNYLGVAINLNSIAWIYELKKDYVKAIEFYKKSLEANIHDNNEKGKAICYSDLGKVYHTIGEHSLALEYYKKTLSVNENLGDKRYIARSYIYIGEVYRDLGDNEKSLVNLQKGLQYAQQVNSRRMLMLAYEQLSLTYEKLNNTDRAYNHFKKYSIYKDSVYDEEKSNQIIEMQTRFETNKKEQENILLKNRNRLNEARIERQRIIVVSIISILVLSTILVFVLLTNRRKQKKAIKLLGKQNDEIRRQKEEIQKQAKDLEIAINTKNRFFSIIAHDLINPFNTIIGFSYTLKESIKNERLEDIREYANLIYQQSNNTHELLLNLLDWSLSQTKVIEYKPREIEIRKSIKDKICLLESQANDKSIELQFIEGDDLMVYADANMLNTIIRNLVSNAIKFTEKGGVTISYTQDLNDCKVTIKDTGVGISEKNLRNLFEPDKSVSTKGTSGEKGSGIGLILCKEFIKQNKGKISVESTEGEGSTFSFTIPLMKKSNI